MADVRTLEKQKVKGDNGQARGRLEGMHLRGEI